MFPLRHAQCRPDRHALYFRTMRRYDPHHSSRQWPLYGHTEQRWHCSPIDKLNLSITQASVDPVLANYKLVLANNNSPKPSKRGVQRPCRKWHLDTRALSSWVQCGLWQVDFKKKFHSDGSLAKYKACLVARGYSQCPRLVFDKTFNPVVKPATMRIVLSLAISPHWLIHQLDVKNAFLHGNLNEIVYCQ